MDAARCGQCGALRAGKACARCAALPRAVPDLASMRPPPPSAKGARAPAGPSIAGEKESFRDLGLDSGPESAFELDLPPLPVAMAERLPPSRSAPREPFELAHTREAPHELAHESVQDQVPGPPAVDDAEFLSGARVRAYARYSIAPSEPWLAPKYTFRAAQRFVELVRQKPESAEESRVREVALWQFELKPILWALAICVGAPLALLLIILYPFAYASFMASP